LLFAFSGNFIAPRVQKRRLWNLGVASDVMSSNSQGDVEAAPNSAAAKRKAGSIVSFGKKLREMTGPYRARNAFLVGTLCAIDGIARLFPKRKQEIEKDRPLRILVANWGHLGDVLTILPLLKFLQSHPRVQELGVLIGSWSRPVLEASNIEAKVHILDHWALDRSPKSASRKIAQYFVRRTSLIRGIRRRYDLSIDTFVSFPSSHFITWAASIPHRVGYTSGGLGPLLTDPFHWVPDNSLMLEHQLKLLKPLLGEVCPEALAASYPGFAAISQASELGVGEKPYIVMHMGQQDKKGWVLEKWVALAAALKEQGYDLIATGATRGEKEVARAVNRKVVIRDLTGQLTWKQFVAAVSKATAVVSVDSVTGHVAACFGVPVVVLTNGRTRLDLWRPNSPNAIALTHSVACAPCNRTNGCTAMACIKRIEDRDVLSLLQQVMQARRSDVSAGSNTPLAVDATDVSALLVSVVIINFNYGRFLEKAVTSALDQTYAPVEIVVVDDGSTDNSLCILKKYEGRVTLISKKRGGHVSAFNAAFAACRGEVIVFLDADDVLRPNCIARVMANWRRGLSKVQFRLDTIDAHGIDQRLPFPHYPPTLTSDEIKRRLLRFGWYPWPVSSGNAFARDFVLQVAPIPQERVFKSPDGFLNKMAPLFGNVEVLNEILGAYRVHGANVWAQSGKAANRATFSQTVRFDAVLHAEFVAAAARLGFTVEDYCHLPVPQWIEMRLLSLRLCPERHPITGDNMLAVLKLGLYSAAVAPGINIVGRLSWTSWFIAIAALPEWPLLYLVKRGRAQSRRSKWARALVGMSKRA
jgi:ADP-heptose:LPS heptosyltransferase